MSERTTDDLELPPPGRRSGAGSASILPYLIRSLATKPHAAAVPASPRAAAQSAPGSDTKPSAG